MSSVRVRRIAAASVAAVGLAVVPALTASAHVTVSSPDATPGGFGKLVFRVPNESDSAGTTALSVDLPTDSPFAFVSVRPVAGWTVETTTEPLAEPVEMEGFTVTEAVANVTWTADSEENGIGPGEFTEFEVSAGPFPEDVDQLMFPATQTYSDGEVVEWAEPVQEGEAEPEHPAPTLALSGSSAPAESDDGGGSSDTLAIVLGAVGVGLGIIALVVALTGRRRREPVTPSVT